MTRPTRILMLSGLGSNLGDQAIFAGFSRVLGEVLDVRGIRPEVDVAFIFDARITPEEILALSAYDAMILAGGGYLYHRPDDMGMSGWALNCPEQLIGRLPPLALYGAGYNWRRHTDRPDFPPHTASHIRATMEHARHVSVREPRSLEKVREAFGVTTPIEVVPDAAFLMEPIDMPIDLGPRPIGVCLRLDHARERFRDMEGSLTELAIALRRLASLGHSLWYVSHLRSPADDWVLGQLRKFVTIAAVHERMPEIYQGCSPQYGEVLAGVYERMHLVIGQRMHSLVLPFSVGTPVVTLSDLESSAWMQEHLGVPSRFALNVDETRAQDLLSAVGEMSADRDEWSRHALATTWRLRAEGREAIEGMVRALGLEPGPAPEPAEDGLRWAGWSIQEGRGDLPWPLLRMKRLDA